MAPEEIHLSIKRGSEVIVNSCVLLSFMCLLFVFRAVQERRSWVDSHDSGSVLLIHSGYFYSASSSPLLLRAAPDYSIYTVSELTCQSATGNCE